MSAPRPRKPRDIETFRERRAKKRRPGTTIGALTVKLVFDPSAFAPVEVIDGIRKIVRDEMATFQSERLARFGARRSGLSEPFKALVEGVDERRAKGSAHEQ